MFRFIGLSFVFVIFLLAVSCSSSFDEKDLIKTVTKENSQFSLRIKAYKQNPTFGIAGIDYLIEAKNEKKGDWKQIMIISHDDGVEFSDNNVIYPTTEVCFVYMINKYAVTLDAGENWQTSEIKKPDSSCLIEEVKLSNDGKGIMSLDCNKKRVEKPTLNYGVDWNE